MLIRLIYKLHQYLPIPWILVGILALGFFLLALKSKDERQTDQLRDGSGFPQYYMRDLQTREFDSQGQLHFQLNTPLVTHFQIDPSAPSAADYTLISQPQMEFYGGDSPAPWLMSAELGRRETDGKLLRLLDKVLIQQDSPARGLIQITTNELRVQPKEQFAETDKAVKMRSAKGQIDAVGMNAQLSDSRVELLSQVKAVYEPR